MLPLFDQKWVHARTCSRDSLGLAPHMTRVCGRGRASDGPHVFPGCRWTVLPPWRARWKCAWIFPCGRAGFLVPLRRCVWGHMSSATPSVPQPNSLHGLPGCCWLHGRRCSRLSLSFVSAFFLCVALRLPLRLLSKRSRHCPRRHVRDSSHGSRRTQPLPKATSVASSLSLFEPLGMLSSH